MDWHETNVNTRLILNQKVGRRKKEKQEKNTIKVENRIPKNNTIDFFK
jgi:hypothetical protein